MEEKNISELESFSLIQQMIQTAKKEQRDSGIGWIVWGWMLFLASILSVVNIHFSWVQMFFFWNAFGIVTLVYFLFKITRFFFFRKKSRVKTYTADLFNKLNAGFFISLIFVILSINIASRALYSKYGAYEITPVNIGFALLINLYAFWVLIYGTALNFRPSIIGAYCTWAVGITALFMKTFEQVMLLHALAVLIGYIIPGHIAYKEFKKLNRKDKVAEGV